MEGGIDDDERVWGALKKLFQILEADF